MAVVTTRPWLPALATCLAATSWNGALAAPTLADLDGARLTVETGPLPAPAAAAPGGH